MVDTDKENHPLNKQVAGSHYKEMEIQPVEYIRANDLGWYEGNVVKYISRHHQKGGREDVLKVIHYCELLLSEYDEESERWAEEMVDKFSSMTTTKDEGNGWIPSSHLDEQTLSYADHVARCQPLESLPTSQPEEPSMPRTHSLEYPQHEMLYEDLDGQYSTLYYYDRGIGNR